MFDATVELVTEAAIDLPRFALLTPFPGTPLHRRLKREGRILIRDWEHYDGQHVVFQPARMSIEQLADGHERAWRSVYRWKAITRRLWRAGNLRPLAISANVGYRFYAHNLHRFYTCDMPLHLVMPAPSALWPGQDIRLAGAGSDNRGVCGG